jgi:hypothetical protein
VSINTLKCQQYNQIFNLNYQDINLNNRKKKKDCRTKIKSNKLNRKVLLKEKDLSIQVKMIYLSQDKSQKMIIQLNI